METIKGSDGLEYADITARLLNEPLDTPRNSRVTLMRERNQSDQYIREFLSIYDDWIKAGETEAIAASNAYRHADTVTGKLAINRYDARPTAHIRPSGKSYLGTV